MSIENKTIAVIGSGLTGLEVAELLQLSGNKTIVVEMLDTIAPGAYLQNVMDVKSRLAEDKTEYLTSHKLIAIKDGAIELKNTKTEDISTRPVDVVYLVGYQLDQAFIDSFKDTAPVVYTGDADKVSNIGMATRSGFQTAYKI